MVRALATSGGRMQADGPWIRVQLPAEETSIPSLLDFCTQSPKYLTLLGASNNPNAMLCTLLPLGA